MPSAVRLRLPQWNMFWRHFALICMRTKPSFNQERFNPPMQDTCFNVALWSFKKRLKTPCLITTLNTIILFPKEEFHYIHTLPILSPAVQNWQDDVGAWGWSNSNLKSQMILSRRKGLYNQVILYYVQQKKNKMNQDKKQIGSTSKNYATWAYKSFAT